MRSAHWTDIEIFRFPIMRANALRYLIAVQLEQVVLGYLRCAHNSESEMFKSFLNRNLSAFELIERERTSFGECIAECSSHNCFRVVESIFVLDEIVSRWPKTILLKKILPPDLVEFRQRLPDSAGIIEFAQHGLLPP
ncbi:MAG: hypothetical protein BGO00_02720 [Alphaproteobacteria bacterium 62-8]|nr:MAG: hypothetical protein BGO00_02720 [Alphaproteobacteria bacterium 62-8]